MISSASAAAAERLARHVAEGLHHQQDERDRHRQNERARGTVTSCQVVYQVAHRTRRSGRRSPVRRGLGHRQPAGTMQSLNAITKIAIGTPNSTTRLPVGAEDGHGGDRDRRERQRDRGSPRSKAPRKRLRGARFALLRRATAAAASASQTPMPAKRPIPATRPNSDAMPVDPSDARQGAMPDVRRSSPPVLSAIPPTNAAATITRSGRIEHWRKSHCRRCCPERRGRYPHAVSEGYGGDHDREERMHLPARCADNNDHRRKQEQGVKQGHAGHRGLDLACWQQDALAHPFTLYRGDFHPRVIAVIFGHGKNQFKFAPQAAADDCGACRSC